MKKVFLTSVASLAIVFPALANIDKSASTATCDSSTIGATSGTAYMDTAWTANTINLQWYSNGEQIDVTGTDSATCTYDDVITLPSTPQVPTGYTFGGWKVRVAAAQSGFDLSTWENGSYIDQGYQNDSTGEWGADSSNTTAYGINGDQQWAVEFTNGTVRGEAVCANNGGELAVAGTPQGTGGEYCWCRATGFDAEKDGTYQNVASSSWVSTHAYDFGDATDCAFACASNCANNVYGIDNFRRAVFGISE